MSYNCEVFLKAVQFINKMDTMACTDQETQIYFPLKNSRSYYLLDAAPRNSLKGKEKQ